ncbi:MAG TPA: sulfite exporter TauE/SafE family protein, partial [Candidatus Binatia bacterium]|nr:sulfite exporter TauE/SafE family protein [Candidatus Binatia bacterium]
KTIFSKELKHIRPLAVVGGFVDASGGGGWGPVVTSTLISNGHQPRTTIGTINAVEFFVALTASGVFSLFVGLTGWHVVLGLIFGGVLAAPVGAYVCHKINPKVCMFFVGLLIIFLSVRTIIRSL